MISSYLDWDGVKMGCLEKIEPTDNITLNNWLIFI